MPNPRRLLRLLATLAMPHAASTFSAPPPSATDASSGSSARLSPPDGRDGNMHGTYDELAHRAIDMYRSRIDGGGGGKNDEGADRDGKALWIGVIGGPGAGKTTLAGAVARRIRDLSSSSTPSADAADSDSIRPETIDAVSIPMDGYHHSQSRLAELYPDDPSGGMNRRGAPWTFDPTSLAADLREARETGRASLPSYDRTISDPVPGGVKVEERHGIVLVEGNYLLLGALAAELDDGDGDGSSSGGGGEPIPGSPLAEVSADMNCPHPIGTEIRSWEDVSCGSLFDETWFVAPPGGVEEQRRRLIERSLETWTPAKTEAWGGGTDREAAVRRADFNDVKNARLVECCRPYADVVVESI